MNIKQFLPFTDLREYSHKTIAQDSLAALAITFISVPQVIAYAMIAGLPAVAGLYAAAVPTIVGSFFRSSKHVITGPSNAVSLLVGGGIAALAGLDPIQVGLTLALMVGVLQLLAGVLRLGAIVNYISKPVVLGYITGAGLLIGVGQLPSITSTIGGKGHVVAKVSAWFSGLGATHYPSLLMAFATAALIVALRRWKRAIPGPLVAVGLATILSMIFDFQGIGMKIIAQTSPIKASLPPLTLPSLDLIPRLLPLAIACTVLSLVESSAVARAIASRTGQRLNSSVEFAGQGLANISAAFFGAYPTSGSLSRSALNEQSGAKGRLSGILSGFMTILVLLFLGPFVNYTPIACLAGLLMVVAVDLVDSDKIKLTVRGTWNDRLAFIVTLIGTWMFPLDQAIYLGVGISLVLFLQQARFLVVHEIAIDSGTNQLREIEKDQESDGCQSCRSIHILHLEGRLFFGAEGELQQHLDNVINNPKLKVLIVRIKRTQGMDVTITSTFEAAAERLRQEGRYILFAGVRESTYKFFEKTKFLESIGKEYVFKSQTKWFASVQEAVNLAYKLVNKNASCDSCPLKQYLRTEARFEENPPEPISPEEQG